MLVRSDTLTRWRLEPLNGISHPRNIETLWSDAELAAIGLYRVVPFVLPEGKRKVSGPTYEIVDGKAVESFVVEDIPPLTDVQKDELVPPNTSMMFKVLFVLWNDMREGKGQVALTPIQFRVLLKSMIDETSPNSPS